MSQVKTRKRRYCSFCASYKNNLEKDELDARIKGSRSEYTVALVKDTWRQDKSFSGRCTMHGYWLNYCPECGRRITE